MFGHSARRFSAIAAASVVVMLSSIVSPVQAAGLGASDEASANSEPSQTESSAAASEAAEPAAPKPSEEPTKKSGSAKSVSPQSVPSATGNNAVITVKTGGDRIGASQVANLQGVKLRLYDGGPSGPSNLVNSSWASCTSDAQGDCSFSVPETQCNLEGSILGVCWSGKGENRDRRFWVVQQSASSGYTANDKLISTSGSERYAFRTGEELRRGSTYRSGSQFMTAPTGGSDSTNPSDSSGIWQNSRTNPQLEMSCTAGLKVALVLDLSGSVANSNAVGDLKSASTGMVDALAGTGSTMSLFTFATTAPRNNTSTGRNYGPMAIDSGNNATTIKNRINGYQAEGGTNWDRGLWQVAGSGNDYDLAVVVTDGQPTFYGDGTRYSNGNGTHTRFIEVEQAIFSANAIKAKGTRVLGVGVGSGVSGAGDNLAAISGPNKYSTGVSVNDSDYFQAGWSELAGLLSGVAKGATCRADIEIDKKTIAYGDASANPGGTGWKFHVESTAGTLSPKSDQTTGSNSKVNYELNFSTPKPSPAQVGIKELMTTAQKDQGWELKDVACTVNEKAVTVSKSDTKLPVTTGDVVKCTVTNEQFKKPGISIEKKAWDTPKASGLPGATEITAGSHVTDGKTITWTYTVTNTGQTALDKVKVVDDQLASTAVTCPKTSLGVSESMTCSASGPVKKQP